MYCLISVCTFVIAVPEGMVFYCQCWLSRSDEEELIENVFSCIPHIVYVQCGLMCKAA